MAESKFLKYQDVNRDNLIDVCETEIPPPEEPVCKDCIPNPKALVPNWKTASTLTPFLNEKICQYQITITTPETTTGADSSSTEQQAEEALQEIYAKYAEEVITNFLDYYDKAQIQANVDVMLESIDYTDYFLDARPLSHLQLLYSFPFEILSLLEDDEEAAEEEEAEVGDIVVEYSATEMATTMVRIRKGLNLYSRYERVYRYTDGGILIFVDTGGLFNLQNYGDIGFSPGASITAKLLPDLDGFLVEKGFNIPGVGGLNGLFEDRVKRLEFTFTSEYALKQLKVYTESCGEVPIVFGSSKLARLNRSESWSDPTAVAYFAQMEQMEQELTARGTNF